MITKLTDWAEAVALLCLALGAAWLVGERFGIGYALLAFGALILCMSAGVTAAGRRRKGGNG
jgi:uncharacterized membrane protein YhfC